MNRKIKTAFITIAPRMYHLWRFQKTMGYKLNTNNPRTLTEKIFCFIMYNRNPLYTKCADKVEVRKYISEKVGAKRAAEICPKHYFTTRDPDSIHMEQLPDQFVLKSNHACGHVIICQDKKEFDLDAAKAKMREWMRVNYFYSEGERHYKDMIPQIICEELLDADITDYRVFCFNGKPEFIRVTKHDPKSQTGYAVGVYDLQWQKRDDVFNLIETSLCCEQPQCLDEMIDIATTLSADFPFVRVDLYEVNGRIYFAELTFTPNGGSFRFKDLDTDLKYGQMVEGDLKK